MVDGRPPRGDGPDGGSAMLGKVEHRAQRKLRARGERDAGIWFSLGMFGLVGWSVAVPALGATALGVWIDKTWPSRVSWTLMLLLIGIAVGCFNAWYWVRRESGRD